MVYLDLSHHLALFLSRYLVCNSRYLISNVDYLTPILTISPFRYLIISTSHYLAISIKSHEE